MGAEQGRSPVVAIMLAILVPGRLVNAEPHQVAAPSPSQRRARPAGSAPLHLSLSLYHTHTRTHTTANMQVDENKFLFPLYAPEAVNHVAVR